LSAATASEHDASRAIGTIQIFLLIENIGLCLGSN
jgi:hypothetical protein